MERMRLLSWNVNGIRAIARKGLLRWIEGERADVICLQETKAREDQIPRALRRVKGYHARFSSPERRGYSGVATYTREEPLSTSTEMGIQRFDREGRMLMTETREFTLFNVYFPNGKASHERLRYKMEFYDAFLEHLLRRGVMRTIICGDVNTAHREIDLARPKENSTVSGFLPEERAWIDRLLDSGFVDSLRHFDPSPGLYTWWDLKTRARERNVGWRIDYFFVSEDLLPNLKEAFIMPDVGGSDHCPIGIEMSFG